MLWVSGVTMSKKGEWSKLGKDKLLSSGITSSDGTALGMYEVVSAALLHKSFEARPALVIPYFDVDKKPLESRPGWGQFYRIRYLDKPFGFKEAAGEKGPKYKQEPNTRACAYFPKSIEWKSVGADTDQPIIITEGELKAAAGCQAGWPCVGLGGVWSFRSAKDDMVMLPEMHKIVWPKRIVYLCFDSDFVTNANVCLAMSALGEAMQNLGALVKFITLPGANDEKVGLDDFLLANGEEAFGDLVKQAQNLGMTSALWRINKEVVYIDNPGLVISVDDMQKIAVGAFKEHSKWATESTFEARLRPNGTTQNMVVPAAPVWIKWPFRRTARKLTYAPGEELMTPEGDLNMWRGWGVKPKKGTVDPWIKLTRFIFSEWTQEQLDYFYDWCAYPIQNPGAKLFVGVVIHGVTQGTGKTLIGYTLGRIYGENFKEITDDDLEETFWAENRQFVLGDEVSGKDNRQYMNTLKRLITKDTVTVNIKFVPQFELPNRMNFLFTSQHGDSFFLEDKDRRFLVAEVEGDPMPEAFYKEYDKWYKGDGAGHLMQWLLDRKINKNFNPAAPAPRTAAKERMILSTKGELGSWIAELAQYPEQVLLFGDMRHTRDLFTTSELLGMFMNRHPNSTKVTAVGLGRQLTAAGFYQVSGGQPLKTPEGTMQRYFCVRNLTTWKKATRKALEENIKKQAVKK